MCMQAQITAQCTLALLNTQNARHTRSTHNAVHACTLPGEHNDGPSSCSSVRPHLPIQMAMFTYTRPRTWCAQALL